MAEEDKKEENGGELPREGSTMYNFHFQDAESRKKKLKRWQGLNKYFMIPLYRANILPLFGIGKVILLLTTKSVKSGKKRKTPLEYRTFNGIITIFSAFGEKSVWVKNLRAYPDDVLVKKGFYMFKPRVEILEDMNQKTELMKTYVSRFGRAAQLLFGWNPKEDDPESTDFSRILDLIAIIKLHEE